MRCPQFLRGAAAVAAEPVAVAAVDAAATRRRAPSHLYTTAKNTALTMAAPGLLPFVAPPAAGTPAPASTMATVATPPMHGKLALKADGSFVYTPEKDYTAPTPSRTQ